MRAIFNSIFTSNLDHKISIPKTAPLMRALEPRILLDAAAVETSFDVAERALLEQQANDYIHQDTDNHNLEMLDALDHAYDSLDADAIAPPLERERQNEYVFIDASIENKVDLIASLDPSANIFVLNGNQDGLVQITEAIKYKENISAIHIISHGDSGALQIGSSELTAQNITYKYQVQMEVIKNALIDDADILIYGCNFGQGEEGLLAAEKLARVTGADVAASDDLTGAKSLNGDWDLEVQVGDVGTKTLQALSYDGILLAANVAAVKTISLHEDGFYEFDPLSRTLDGQIHTYADTNAATTAVGVAQNGTVSLVEGKIRYQVNAGYTGQDTFTYTVTSNGIEDVVTVTANVSAHDTVAEDSPTALRSSNFSESPDFSGIRLTNVQLSAGASLTLNGIDVTNNTVVSKSEIDAGKLVFTPAADFNGKDGLRLTYDVLPVLRVLEGHTGSTIDNTTNSSANLASVNVHLLSEDNFGIDGKVEQKIKFIPDQSNIDADYLLQGDVYFSGFTHDTEITDSETEALYQWVEKGGFLIGDADFSGSDKIATRFGLPAGSSGISATWNVTADTNALTHPILNGPFGQLTAGASIINSSVTGNYFNASDINAATDIILVHDGADTNKPTLVLRSVGKGYVLFTTNEQFFTSGTIDINTFNSNDIIINNFFAWAASQQKDISDTPSGELVLDVTPVQDTVVDSISLYQNGFYEFDPLERTRTNQLHTFTDPNVTTKAVGTASKGTVTLVDGKIKYTPNDGYKGSDTFTYTVSSHGTDEVTTVDVNVEAPLEIFEDEPLTLSSANLVGSENYTGIKITAIETGTIITLNGEKLSVGDSISKVDIDAGNVKHETIKDFNGRSSFAYEVSPIITLLEGNTSDFNIDDSDSLTDNFSSTNRHIRDNRNFGIGGTIENDFNFISEQTTVDSAYLNRGNIFFGGYRPVVTTQEANAVYDWVNGGGVAIITSDNIDADAYSTRFGLPAIGDNRDLTTNDLITISTDDETLNHPILKGPFGTLTSADTISGYGTYSWPDANSLTNDDVVLAYTANGQPGVILRKVGLGEAIFIYDEGIFRQGNTDPTSFNNNDIFINNLFAYMSDKVNKAHTQSEFVLNIKPVQDSIVDSISVHEDGLFEFNPLSQTLDKQVASFADMATLSSVSDGEHGTVTFANGKIKYIADAGYMGTDSFTYTIKSGGVDEVTTVNVDVIEHQTLIEDTPTKITSTDFTNSSEFSGVKLSNIELKNGATLTLNGQAVTNGMSITKTDIDAGKLVYTPPKDFYGKDGLKLTYQLIPTLRLLEGHNNSNNTATLDNTTDESSFYAPINIHLLSENNFGANGTVKNQIKFIADQNDIDAQYLNQGDFYFGGYVKDTKMTNAEIAAINEWVTNGGYFIGQADNSTVDALSASFGLPSGTGTTDINWTPNTDPSVLSHPIMNGPFGKILTTEKFITTYSGFHFNTADINDQTDIVLAYSNGDTTKPTLVLRQIGQGYALLAGNEQFYQGGTKDPATFNATDKLINNFFAWAGDNLTVDFDEPSGKLTLDVISADDDFDGDGIEDADDIDDDNDGILDINEPNLTYPSRDVAIRDGSSVTYTFPNINDDVIFNITRLDDSFSLKINDQLVSGGEMLFYPSSRGTLLVFANGNTIPTVWEQIGTEENPIIQYRISPEGKVTIFGRNSHGDLEQMYLQGGAEIADVSIYNDVENVMQFSQAVSGPTNLYGKMLTPSDVFDSDEDGQVNSFDLDSDNDGISDLQESGFVRAETTRLLAVIKAGEKDNASDAEKLAATKAQAKLVKFNQIIEDGTISLAESLTYARTNDSAGVDDNTDGDLDNDGLLDIFDYQNDNQSVDASRGTAGVDTDSDGYKDATDLDSDGDGIADTIEAQTTLEYIGNDGDVSNEDEDGDGIINQYEGAGSKFGGKFSAPLDSDRDGMADYIDTDSDGDGKSDASESGLTLSGKDLNFDGIDDSLNASYKNPDGNVDERASIFAHLKNTKTFENEAIEVDYRDSAVTAVADFISANEDKTLTISSSNGLLSNDVDTDFDELTLKSFTIAGVDGTQTFGQAYAFKDKGSLIINADGSYSFTPVTNYNGSIPVITYKIQDSDGNQSSATLTINVTPVNDAPTSTTINNQAAQDEDIISLNIPSKFNDVDDDDLSFSATGLPDGLSITNNGGNHGTVSLNTSQGTSNGNSNGIFKNTQFLDTVSGAILQTIENADSLDRIQQIMASDKKNSSSRTIFNKESHNQSYTTDLTLSVGKETNRKSIFESFLDTDIFATNDKNSDNFELKLNAFVRHHTLYLDVINEDNSKLKNRVISYNISGINNQRLPDWIKMADKHLIIAEYPVNAKTIEFVIKLKMANGETIESPIRIENLSGALEVTRLNDYSNAPKIGFSDRIKSFINASNVAIQ